MPQEGLPEFPEQIGYIANTTLDEARLSYENVLTWLEKYKHLSLDALDKAKKKFRLPRKKKKELKKLYQSHFPDSTLQTQAKPKQGFSKITYKSLLDVSKALNTKRNLLDYIPEYGTMRLKSPPFAGIWKGSA